MRQLKYFSTFTGIGGFELGIQQAYVDTTHRSTKRGKQKNTQHNDAKGTRLVTPSRKSARTKKGWASKYSQHQYMQREPTCVGYSEIDKYAIEIYQRHFPNHKNYGDITTINAKELPDFDLIVGGFPCQAFSIAGKRGGFDDTRGTLFFDVARIAREKQPRLLLLENVKGLLSHDQGRTFYTIISTLDELGYDCQWQVLNSKNHGVPQNRERVFIIGHLRGTPRPQVFPFGEADEATDERHQQSNTEVASTLRSRYGNGTGSHIKQLNQPKHSNDRVYGTGGVSPILNTMQGGRRQPFIQTIPHGFNDGWQKELPNLRAHSGAVHNEILMPYIRRLTPTECERLQGFPDGWTERVSDTQRYKTLGNAVTVSVVREIMLRIL